MRTASLFPELSQIATQAGPFVSSTYEYETPTLSDERAGEFGRMIACHLAAGRFGVAHKTIEWATREAKTADEQVAMTSPLASLALPLRVVDLLERHNVVYVFELCKLKPEQIKAWPQSSRSVVRLIRKSLKRHGITIWKK
ncbi:MAG: hypothetical protein NXI22_20680 [bacterium]|nr:hypothetical protein [bacterium]